MLGKILCRRSQCTLRRHVNEHTLQTSMSYFGYACQQQAYPASVGMLASSDATATRQRAPPPTSSASQRAWPPAIRPSSAAARPRPRARCRPVEPRGLVCGTERAGPSSAPTREVSCAAAGVGGPWCYLGAFSPPSPPPLDPCSRRPPSPSFITHVYLHAVALGSPSSSRPSPRPPSSHISPLVLLHHTYLPSSSFITHISPRPPSRLPHLIPPSPPRDPVPPVYPRRLSEPTPVGHRSAAGGAGGQAAGRRVRDTGRVDALRGAVDGALVVDRALVDAMRARECGRGGRGSWTGPASKLFRVSE
jgi:hypothetical protein